MYMQSNEPYHRIENDSVWSGAMIGGAIGGAAAGATQLWGDKGLNAFGDYRQNKADANYNKVMGDIGSTAEQKRNADQRMKTAKDLPNKLKGYRNKGFGSGKAKTLSYAGSVIAGGLGGMAIDAMNKPG